MIPLRPGRRTGLIWAGLLVLIAALALVGGLPGGGDRRVNLKRVFEPFPAAPPADGRTLGSPDSTGFVSRVGRDVEQTWTELFREAGIAYRPVKRVVFDRGTSSACGLVAAASSDVFYCADDQKLLLDAGIAYPYLVAHSHAHHVQEVLGITEQVRRAAKASPGQAPDLWLRHELQADCLAGVWAYSAYRKLDVAAAVGLAPVAVEPDLVVDRKQWRVTTVEQRTRWFRRGFRDGKPAGCDTFSRNV